MQEDVRRFMDDHIYPNEEEYYAEVEELGPDGYPPIMDKLKAAATRARACGTSSCPTWRPIAPGTKLSNLDYAPISEQLGQGRPSRPRRSTARRPTPATWRSSTSTARSGSSSDWLAPLLEGEIRSRVLA